MPAVSPRQTLKPGTLDAPGERLVILRFAALAYLASWSLWSLLFLPGVGESGWATWLIVAGGFGPVVAAFVTVWREGRAALKAWLRSLLVWRVSAGWYALALVLPFVFGFTAYGLYLLLGGAVPADWRAAPWAVYPLLLAFVCLLGGGQEEAAWRGFLLPRLQRRYSALNSSLVLGVVWAFWHLPLFFVPASSQRGLKFGLYLLMTIAMAFLYTWLFNSTGSVLVVMLLHAGSNAVANYIPFYAADGPVSQLGAVVVVLWVIATLLVIRYGPNLSSHVRTGVPKMLT